MIRPRPRVLLAIPLALLATGCATIEPFTPATDAFGEEAPFSRAATLPAFHDAALKWELPVTDPWAPYVKMTLLSALDAHPRAGERPDVESLDLVGRARRAAASVAAGGVPSNAMWVVDLRGPASVAFGATLSQRSSAPISPVITFNNWPAEREVVPAEQTLAALCVFEPRAPTAAADRRVPMFLLDSWRLAYRDDEPEDELTDNRYMLTPSDLPSVELLRAQGIDRVIYVIDRFDAGSLEEDDLHETFLDYQRSGITIHFVDLDWLTRGRATPDRESWVAELPNVTFTIEPRSTVVVDPGFYRRSQGGFGGIHGGGTAVGREAHYGVASPHIGGRSSYHAASAHFGGHGGG